MLIIFNPVAGGSRRRRLAAALRAPNGRTRVQLAETTHPGVAGFSVPRFPQAGPAGAMLAGLSLPFHTLHRVPGAVLTRASMVTPRGAAPSQADGDAAGGLPVEVRDAAQCIPFLVPYGGMR